MDDTAAAMVSEALRTLFLGGVPVIVVLGIVGTLAGAIQGATTIRDAALNYTAKLLAFLVLLYLLMPLVVRTITELAQTAWS
jgi:type III secretory pathway component EscS